MIMELGKGVLAEGTLIARYTVEGGDPCVGRVTPEGLEALGMGGRPTGEVRSAESVRFDVPFSPTKIWCVGANYSEHIKETGSPFPDEPQIFMKPLTAVSAHGATIAMPSWAGRVDYEGELAVVVKDLCKNVDESEALDHVLGYTCFNDVTARELQAKDRQWIRGKGFDGFAPFGPYLLLAKSMPGTAMLTTRHNGKIVQSSPLSDMLFSVAQIISFISRFATLEPGDLIATGTPSGIAPIADGDVVEVTIDGIGTLSNRYVKV